MNSRLLFLLAATAATWTIALNTGRELAFSLAYLFTGLLAGSLWWAWQSVRSLRALRRTKSRRSQVGQYVEEQFEVTNHALWPKLWLEFEDQSTLPWHSASRVLNAMGHRGTQRWLVRTLCQQRGRFRLGPVVLRSGDPLGILRRELPLAGETFVTVYPATFEIATFEPAVSELTGGEARHRRTHQITSSVAGLREYATGDSLQRIHWPTTARLQRLIVKEFELDPTADVWIYLDLCQSAAASLPWSTRPPESPLFRAGQRRPPLELPPDTTEYGVAAAASLARYYLLRNRAVGMNSRGRTREWVQADRGERQLNKFLDTLAVVEAAGPLPFAHLIATDGIRLHRNDMLIAITPDDDPAWVTALQLLQRRGVRSVAVLLDSSTFGAPRSYTAVQAQLLASAIPCYRLRRGDDLGRSLATPLPR